MIKSLVNEHFKPIFVSSSSWDQCCLILTEGETQQLWPGVEKGELFSLCGAKVHNLTLAASTRLHNSQHVKEKKNWQEGRKKRGNIDERGRKGGGRRRRKRKEMMSCIS